MRCGLAESSGGHEGPLMPSHRVSQTTGGPSPANSPLLWAANLPRLEFCNSRCELNLGLLERASLGSPGRTKCRLIELSTCQRQVEPLCVYGSSIQSDLVVSSVTPQCLLSRLSKQMVCRTPAHHLPDTQHMTAASAAHASGDPHVTHSYVKSTFSCKG